MADVFISYSRKDTPFVHRLNDALCKINRSVWVDWRDIPPTAEWLKEVFAAIEGADTIVFVISPDSVESDICKQEVAHAVKDNKRLLPIVYKDVDPKEVPEPLSRLNWILFREDDDFDGALGSLLKAIDTDLDWVRAHKRLVVRSKEWKNTGRDRSLLLRGSDLRKEEQLLSAAGGKEPRPTALQIEYVLASRKAEVSRQRTLLVGVASVMVLAVLLSFVALHQRQQAVQSALYAEHQRQQAVQSALYAERQRQQAVQSALYAERQRQQAVQQSRRALCGKLAAEATSHLDDRLDLALLLAVEACRIAPTLEARSCLLKAMNHHPQLSTFLRGHEGEVTHVAFSPDGDTLASGSADGSIILWDLTTRMRIGQPFTGHRGSLTGISFSPDGNVLASASLDTVILWDVKAHKAIAPLPTDSGAMCLAFNPVRNILALGNSDGSVTLWNVTTRKAIGSPLIRYQAPSKDRSSKAVSVQEKWLNCLAFSPDGRFLACGGYDSTVVLWNAETGTRIGEPMNAHRGKVWSIAFSPDGTILASGHGYKTVVLWDARTRDRIRELCAGPGYYVTGVAFSQDGSILASASGGNTIKLWDLRTNDSAGHELTRHEGLAACVAFSPQGKMLASGGSHEAVVMWNLENGSPVSEPLTRGERKVNCMAFSADELMWDLENRNQAGEPLSLDKREVNCMAFSPDGKTLVSASRDTVFLWGLSPRGKTGKPLAGHRNPVTSVSFSPDGQILASASQDTIILWDAKAHSTIGGLSAGRSFFVKSLRFRPNGRILASASRDSVILWDVKSLRAVGGQPISRSTRVSTVSFNIDGRILASGDCDGNVIVQNLETPGLVWKPLAGPRDWVNDVSFSPEGKILASASQKSIMLWDLKTQATIREPLAGLNRLVTRVLFSTDGSTLASGDDGGTIVLWDVNTHKVIGVPLDGQRSKVTSVALSQDGKFLASGCEDGTVTLWGLSTESWENRACRIANRNLTREEWKQYLGNEPYHKTCRDLPIPEGPTGE